ncbi:excalibur calcium-binding domain-containing protein [Mesobacterium hydrothermale]
MSVARNSAPARKPATSCFSAASARSDGDNDGIPCETLCKAPCPK